MCCMDNRTEIEKQAAEKKREEEAAWKKNQAAYAEFYKAAFGTPSWKALGEKGDDNIELPDPNAPGELGSLTSSVSSPFTKLLKDTTYIEGDARVRISNNGKKIHFLGGSYAVCCDLAMRLIRYQGTEKEIVTVGMTYDATTKKVNKEDILTFISKAEKYGLAVDLSDEKIIEYLDKHPAEAAIIKEREKKANAHAAIVQQMDKYGVRENKNGDIGSYKEYGEFHQLTEQMDNNSRLDRAKLEKLEKDLTTVEDSLSKPIGQSQRPPLEAEKLRLENEIKTEKEKFKDEILARAPTDREKQLTEIEKELADISRRMDQLDKARITLQEDATKCEKILENTDIYSCKDNRNRYFHHKFQAMRKEGEDCRNTLFKTIDEEQNDLALRSAALEGALIKVKDNAVNAKPAVAQDATATAALDKQITQADKLLESQKQVKERQEKMGAKLGERLKKNDEGIDQLISKMEYKVEEYRRVDRP